MHGGWLCPHQLWKGWFKCRKQVRMRPMGPLRSALLTHKEFLSLLSAPLGPPLMEGKLQARLPGDQPHR